VPKTLTAVLVAVVLGATACGSDDDGDSSEVGALSKSEFAEQANDLCSKATGDRGSVLAGIDPSESGPEQAEQLSKLIDIDQKLLADVDQLVPPQSEQATVTQLLDRWRDRIDLEEQLRTATADDDATQVSELDAHVQQVDTEANQIADGLGLDACTRGEGV
jgi:ABC-type phosphate/phosphonate transport system substrate-binding protein